MKVTMLYALATVLAVGSASALDQEIIHDAEYYILAAQNGEQWAKDDMAIDQKLKELRDKNDGKPPNIVYILLDDVGFGEIGMDELSVVRGYEANSRIRGALRPANTRTAKPS